MEQSLHKLHTGLFVESDKSKILVTNINTLLKSKHKVKAVSFSVEGTARCEIILYSLQESGCDFSTAKAVLEQYFAMIKEYRPNFVVEKKPEMIDLDEERDLSVICVGDVVQEISVIDLDCTEETKADQSEDDIGADEEVICLEDDDEVSLKSLTHKLNSMTADKTNTSLNCQSRNGTSTSEPNNKHLVSSLHSNPTDRSELKESNHQTQVNKLSDVTNKIEIVEIPDDDDDVDVGSNSLEQYAFSSQKKTPKIEEDTSKTIHLSKVCSGSNNLNSPSKSSNTILNSVLALEHVSDTLKQAVSSIINTQSTPEKKKPARKRKKLATVNILDVPDNLPSTSSAKKSKLSYRKPAHLVKPLVQTVTGAAATVVSSDAQYNIYNPNAGLEKKKTGLRPIVIDGNNVGVSHGKGTFSMKGIQICVNYFEMKGHRQIKVFLPQYRKNRDTHDLILKMERQGTLVVTPSRRVDGKVIASYDDRYIVQYAAACGGVIISTDNYRDLMDEDPSWTDTIKNRLLMFTWADDMLMFPQDPLGRHGPSLRDFLKFPD